MAERPEGFYNIPRDPIKGSISDLLGQAKQGFNEKFGLPFVDIGIGLGDMIFGESPELMSDLAHGADLWKGKGFGGRLDTRAADIAGLAGLFGGVPKNLLKGAIKGNLANVTKGITQSQKGYIVVPSSKLFDSSRLVKAKSMQIAGASVDEIFEKTRTFLGHPDGTPRQEITHGDERFLTDKELRDEYSALASKIFLDSTEGKSSIIDEGRLTALENLQDDTGMLRDRLVKSPLRAEDAQWFNTIRTRGTLASDTGTGAWMPGGKFAGKKTKDKRPSMYVDSSQRADLVDKTVRHEGNHALMYKAGLEGGGNVDTIPDILRDSFEDALDYFKLRRKGGFLDQEELRLRRATRKNLKIIQTLDDDERLKLYKALPDESQARLVEWRWKKTQGQMDADPFHKKYPVSLDDMIFTPDSLPGVADVDFDMEKFMKRVNKNLPSNKQLTLESETLNPSPTTLKQINQGRK